MINTASGAALKLACAADFGAALLDAHNAQGVHPPPQRLIRHVGDCGYMPILLLGYALLQPALI